MQHPLQKFHHLAISKYCHLLFIIGMAFILLTLPLVAAQAKPDSMNTKTGTDTLKGRINVNSTEDSLNSGDGKCTLREALENSNNNNRTYVDCESGGSDVDTIVLSSRNHCLQSTGLRITDHLNITTNGGQATINGKCDEESIVGSVLYSSDSITINLSNLKITGGSNPNGGGIYITNDDNNLTLNDCVVSNNEATSTGGGISTIGYLTLINTVIENNTHGRSTCSSSGEISSMLGLGIYATGNLVVKNSTIRNNQSTLSCSSRTNMYPGAIMGGGIYSSGTLTMEQSTVDNNIVKHWGAYATTSSGGGLYNMGTALITNSTITNNHALLSAGGIHNSSRLTLRSSTVTHNSVDHGDERYDIFRGDYVTNDGEGGGINNWGILILSDTILSNNDAGEGMNCMGSINQVDHVISDDLAECAAPSVGSHIIIANPQLQDLDENGGATKTRALKQSSPAIDAGSCDADHDGVIDSTTDQRGEARVSGSACDIGAYERSTANSSQQSTTQPGSADTNKTTSSGSTESATAESTTEEDASPASSGASAETTESNDDDSTSTGTNSTTTATSAPADTASAATSTTSSSASGGSGSGCSLNKRQPFGSQFEKWVLMITILMMMAVRFKVKSSV